MPRHSPPASPVAAPSGRTAGIVIAAATVLSIGTLALHPTVAASGAAEVLAAIAQAALLDETVHGVLIATEGALAVGFSLWALRLGLHRADVLAGLVAYLAGCIGVIGAALVDGFIVPGLAARLSGAPDDARIAYDLEILCGVAIQCLTKLGLAFLAAGILAWSVALLGERGAARATGVVGLLAAGLSSVALAMPRLVLTPHSLMALWILQAVWNLAAARLLVRDLPCRTDEMPTARVP